MPLCLVLNLEILKRFYRFTMNVFEEELKIIEQAKIDPAAFSFLYECYVDKIYNYIYYRIHNHQDAEDLTAGVFQRALDKIDTYKDKGYPFSAWLYTIAHNLVANWHRDEQKCQTIPLEQVSMVSSQNGNPFQTTVKKEKVGLLAQSIKTLSPVRQQLLTLKFIEGETNAEIGRILNRSEGAVKSLYHRTMVSLKTMLSDYPEFFDNIDPQDDD